MTREENVYPMIAPGQAARDMVGLTAMGEPGTKELL